MARARYQALATLLDRRGGVRAGALGSNRVVDRTAALAVAEALAYYRRGLGPKALTALKRPGAMALLEAHGEALRGGVERFVADCKLYRGQSRPFVSDLDLLAMLHLEQALLAGAERSWAGELLLTGGRPLVEVDPDRLDEAFGVTAELAYFRNGEWRRTP